MRRRRVLGDAADMKSWRGVFFILGGLLGMLGVTSCSTTVDSLGGAKADRAEIENRIASIRDSIRARKAEGIVHYGTADWSFTGPDGVTFNRASYLVRAEALFARVPVIESLETKIDRLVTTVTTAEVEITQTMVRREIDPATKAESRVWLRYREQHLWLKTDRGWCVQRVAFLGAPERKILPPGP